MDPLLILTIFDGSTLRLGEDPELGLVFEEDPGAPTPLLKPVRDGFGVFWPAVALHPPLVVFAGEAAPGVDRVDVKIPGDTLPCPVRDARGRRVWMSFPKPAELVEGATVTATWLAGRRVVATRQTEPLRSPWVGFGPPS